MVEDDENMALFNARKLKRNGYDAIVAHTAGQARAFIGKSTPDLFVIDVELPDGNGFSLCREFRQCNDAPVLFLTGRNKLTDKLNGLDSGGDYYLTKPYEMDEFLAVVQSLIRREAQTRKKVAEASIIKRGPLTLHLSQGKAFVNGCDAGLTQKEFAVLLLLIQNEGKKLAGEVIYESVFDGCAARNIDTGTVRVHISRLKKKLGQYADFSILNEYGGGYTFIAHNGAHPENPGDLPRAILH
jgi:DNA-binding response OmpR family regulator